ncbi:MAG: YlmC/YmxH family sporulation protein [Clostridia bacterium]|nr:YlmC/YmxH family sporulation protein [Clostridia bacterium]
MSSSGLDFKHKDVININTGKKLGFVQDVNADLSSGTISSIVVCGEFKILNLFSDENILTIPWNKIKCIGEDVILVDI